MNGEPVTEEMMAEWERACDEAAQNNGREVRADVLAEDFDVPDAMRTLVAEVRRLRALDTQGYNVGFATGKHAGDAAGYARAERDVAEAAKKQATKKRERDWSGDEVAACALEDFADNIEQGAYRGAAKDEAPRGGSEGPDATE